MKSWETWCGFEISQVRESLKSRSFHFGALGASDKSCCVSLIVVVFYCLFVWLLFLLTADEHL